MFEHFLKQDFGLKEKKQSFSEKQFSTQASMFWVVHCGEIMGHSWSAMQIGHVPPSTTTFGVLFAHENNNKIGISRNFLFIAPVYLNLDDLSREKDLFRIDLLL